MDNPKQNYTALMLLAFMLSLLPEVGFSLGFGQIKLNSYLNETLDAEIELQGAEDIDTSHLIVTLASVEDFKRIELARPYFLSELHFEVIQKNKQAILKITSEGTVKQPYLEFLVQFTWPEGRVVRDYTLLLDPAPFGDVSKRAANEQALQMLNQADLREPASSEPLERLESASVGNPLEPKEPFQDPAAILALQEKSTKQENRISPTPIAETKGIVGTSDAPSNIIVDKQKPVGFISNTVINPPTKSILSRNQILLGSGLALLLVVALSAWFLKRTRAKIRLSPANRIKIMEDIAIFDEEIKLKLDLASQYLSCQDIQNAEAILDEIIARGNTEEIKLAEEILKKCQ